MKTETAQKAASQIAHLGPDTALYFDSYTIKSDNGWAELLSLIETLQFSPSTRRSAQHRPRFVGDGSQYRCQQPRHLQYYVHSTISTSMRKGGFK